MVIWPRGTAVLKWRRALWITVAAAILLAGLWDDRSAILGSQPDARAVALPTATPAPTSIPLLDDPVAQRATGVSVQQAGKLVHAANGLLVIDIDLVTGSVSMRWPGEGNQPAAELDNGLSGVLLRGSTGSGIAGELLARDYAQHSLTTTSFKDQLGSGQMLIINHEDPLYPLMQLRIALYRNSPAVVLRAQLGTSNGASLDVTRLDPLIAGNGRQAITLPGGADPLVLALNGLTADHMPRQFVTLTALPAAGPLPYVTAFTSAHRGDTLLAGTLQAIDWFPTVLQQHDARGVTELILANTGPTSGREIRSEPFLLGHFADGAQALRAYAQAASRIAPPPTWAQGVQLGWSSWGAFELNVSEQRVKRNTDFMARSLRGLGYTTIHIDDGWERAYGDWQAARGFPSGMGVLASYIHHRGLRASLWVAPFLALPNTPLVRAHPDWLLRNVDGSPVTIMVSGQTDVLDVTNPAVVSYVTMLCAQIRDWGFDGVKLDFLYVAGLEGQRYRFDLNGVQAYNRIMTLVRNTLEANPHHPIYLTGVQQGFLPSGYFHAWRVGRDIESKTNADHVPTWDLVRREALAVNTFAFANGALYATDPDDLLVRTVTGAHNLSPDELQTYASMVALGGTVWLSGDDLPTLSAQGRLGYLTNPEVLAVVRSGHAGIPVGLIDQSAGPAPLWNAVQTDGSTILGVFNWSEKPSVQTVTLASLGLGPDTVYRVRDLWAHADLGLQSGTLRLTLRPHQCYLLRLSTP